MFYGSDWSIMIIMLIMELWVLDVDMSDMIAFSNTTV